MLPQGGSGLTKKLTGQRLLKLIRLNVVPLGDKDRINLVYTLPGGEKFVPGSLEVWLSGNKLIPLRDFTEDVNQQDFILILNPLDPSRLNVPPFQDEPITVNYLLDIL